jgi:hypothetical protein
MTPPPKSINNSLGSIVIGVTVSLALYGITMLQAYDFLIFEWKKHPILRYVVILMLGVDTLHSVGLCNIVYDLTVSHFGDFTHLQENLWSLQSSIITGAFIGTIVHLINAIRIMKGANKSIIKITVSMAIGVLSVGQLALTVVYLIKKAQVGTFSDTDYTRPYQIAAIGLSVAANILVTIFLTLLFKEKGHDGVTFIDKIVTDYIDSGFLTLVFTICSFIMVLASPNTLIYIAFYFIAPKLYIISILCTLNDNSCIDDDFPPNITTTAGNSYSLSDRSGSAAKNASSSVMSTGFVVAGPAKRNELDSWVENDDEISVKGHDESKNVFTSSM